MNVNVRWLCGLVLVSVAAAAATPEPVVLARVEAPLPQLLASSLFACPYDAAGRGYCLVLAPASALAASSARHVVLDARAAAPGAYALATARVATSVPQGVTVLHNDGVRLVVRATAAHTEEMAAAGWEIVRLGPHSIPPPSALRAARAADRLARLSIAYDPQVAAMIAQVAQTTLVQHVAILSGETPATIGGSLMVITSRHTQSGAPARADTQYAFERLQASGLSPMFRAWTNLPYANRNVYATIPGTVAPDEYVYVTAHIDDMPAVGRAPGADDNASGAAAVLALADILAGHTFDRSIRFALFTGEEQGLLGSTVCAYDASTQGLAIVAVYNMDMIAWDSNGDNVLRLHTRLPSVAGFAADSAIAAVCTNVIGVYGLTNVLVPLVTSNGLSASDHGAFWNRQYPAILAIEDDLDDFNPHYHTTNDILAHTDMDYCTDFTRASIATVAHLAAAVPEPAACLVLVTILCAVCRRHGDAWRTPRWISTID